MIRKLILILVLTQFRSVGLADDNLGVFDQIYDANYLNQQPLGDPNLVDEDDRKSSVGFGLRYGGHQTFGERVLPYTPMGTQLDPFGRPISQ